MFCFSKQRRMSQVSQMIQCPDTRQWSYILYVKTLDFKRQPEFQTFWDPRNQQTSTILFTQSYQRDSASWSWECGTDLHSWSLSSLVLRWKHRVTLCSTLSSQQLRPCCSSPVRVLGGFSSGKEIFIGYNEGGINSHWGLMIKATFGNV